MSKSKTFAARLCEALESQGVTQYALAKSTGVSKQVIWNLAVGKSEPTWATVQKIAAALGVDFTAFVDPAVVELPPDAAAPPRPRGRPRKEPAEPTPTAPPARRTGRKLPGKPKRGGES